MVEQVHDLRPAADSPERVAVGDGLAEDGKIGLTPGEALIAAEGVPEIPFSPRP
jgi:hypothetical protein